MQFRSAPSSILAEPHTRSPPARDARPSARDFLPKLSFVCLVVCHFTAFGSALQLASLEPCAMVLRMQNFVCDCSIDCLANIILSLRIFLRESTIQLAKTKILRGQRATSKKCVMFINCFHLFSFIFFASSVIFGRTMFGQILFADQLRRLVAAQQIVNYTISP